MTISPFGPKEQARWEARHPPTVVATEVPVRSMIQFAPPVPHGYWGSVTFQYRMGVCETVTVTETCKAGREETNAVR